MRDQKILVTGPTGQVAGPVATSLAKDDDVCATARFSDAIKKAELEADGVTDQTLESVMTDNARMRELVGASEVSWKNGLRRMVEDRHPDWMVI